MSEIDEAIKLANRILDRINADPDDDLAILARRLLREIEWRPWTTKRPSIPGRYWWRSRSPHFDPEVYLVKEQKAFGRKTLVCYWAEGDHDHMMNVDDMGGEWSSGPIPEPTEGDVP